MKKKNKDSRHFARMWDSAIVKTLKVVLDECDNEFKESCQIRVKESGLWRKALEKEYRTLRDELKMECYGNTDGSLDSRKIGAVICSAMIREKPICFDVEAAEKLLAKKEDQLGKPSVPLNRWAADNVYVNYKAAYYASLQLVYLALVEILLDKPETRMEGLLLNQIGHLCRYPTESKADCLDVNVIIGLARSDHAEQDLDMFLFAMNLYQMEQYTRKRMQQRVLMKDYDEEKYQRLLEELQKKQEQKKTSDNEI